MGAKLRTLLLPTVLTGLALVVLVSLGNWQVRRLAWKEDLIARVAERPSAAPLDLRGRSPAEAGDPEAFLKRERIPARPALRRICPRRRGARLHFPGAPARALRRAWPLGADALRHRSLGRCRLCQSRLRAPRHGGQLCAAALRRADDQGARPCAGTRQLAHARPRAAEAGFLLARSDPDRRRPWALPTRWETFSSISTARRRRPRGCRRQGRRACHSLITICNMSSPGMGSPPDFWRYLRYIASRRLKEPQDGRLTPQGRGP